MIQLARSPTDYDGSLKDKKHLTQATDPLYTNNSRSVLRDSGGTPIKLLRMLEDSDKMLKRLAAKDILHFFARHIEMKKFEERLAAKWTYQPL